MKHQTKSSSPLRLSKWCARIYMSIVFLFLYAPILILMLFSFNDARSRGHWGGFTLKWYGELFRDQAILEALYNTITIAIVSAIVATIIGSTAAIGMHYMKRRIQSVVMNISYLPVLNPDIVTGVSLMLLFGVLHMSLGYITMLLAHITFNIPYVILCVRPKLIQMNPHTLEAANDLGANNLYAFRHVVLPQIMPGIINGLLLSFALSIDDFVISFFTTGAGVENLSILIFSMAKTGVKPTMNALSTLMFLTVLILLVIINKRTTVNTE